MVLKIIFKDIMSSIFPFFIKLIQVYTGEHHYQNKVKFSIVYFADVCSENFTYTNTWKQKEFLLVLTVNFFTTFRIICQKLHDELSLKITVYALPTNRLI